MRHSLVIFLFLCSVQAVVAMEGAKPLKKVEIPLNNKIFRDGSKVVIGMCVTCHSLKYIKYRHLLDIGIPEQDVDAIRGPKDMNDAIQSLMPSSNLKASFGSVPPDLSLIARARKNGPQYIYSLLTGYYMNDGKVDNYYFPGIAMRDPFGYATSDADEKAKIEQFAVNTTAFLVWASDPNKLARQSLGNWVIVYLVVFTLLMYWVKKIYWRDVKDGSASLGNKNK